MIPEELNFNFIRDQKKTWQATMMKKCKCGANESKSERVLKTLIWPGSLGQGVVGRGGLPLLGCPRSSW